LERDAIKRRRQRSFRNVSWKLYYRKVVRQGRSGKIWGRSVRGRKELGKRKQTEKKAKKITYRKSTAKPFLGNRDKCIEARTAAIKKTCCGRGTKLVGKNRREKSNIGGSIVRGVGEKDLSFNKDYLMRGQRWDRQKKSQP